MIIIALKGKNGSGKSTVARFLSQKLTEKGVTNKVLAFADPLKRIVNNLTNGGYNWDNREIKDKGGRSLLENYADAIKDSFSFNPFFSQVYKDIQDFQLNEMWSSKEDKFVAIISDLRFKSEYEYFPALQTLGKVVVVEIDNPLTRNNPSEYDLDAIPSNKTLVFNSKVEEQIDALITELL
jgi:energy-coupling factor transporter ATP-binding protein EcfA2